MFDTILVDDQTVKISFRNHGLLPPYPIKDFEDFERELNVGDSFVMSCQEYPADPSYLSIYQFNGTRQDEQEILVDFIHGGAESHVPCNYPQIVDYSMNVFELRN